MSQLILWQGFEHEWQREVLGFRLAHRLSSLVNYIEAEGEGEERAMVAGASPGVDGNFMEPRCFYRKVRAPEVRDALCTLELEGTDHLGEAGSPSEASLELQGEFTHLVKAGVPCDAILAGIDLSWKCDPDKQPDGWPGNSDGVWPAELDVAIDAPVHLEGKSTWQVRVRVVRGWTPMRGGVPLVAEKRLNHTLDFRARIHIQILEGHGLRIERRESIQIDGQIRSEPRLMGPAIARESAQTVAGMSQFGFVIPAHEVDGPKRHRGRYLSAMGLGIEETATEHSAWGRVWAPVTVVPAAVTHTITPVLLHFDEHARIEEQRVATTRVRSNSSDQAPFFSTYKKFEEDLIRDRVPLV